jgi:hypothetical protein
MALLREVSGKFVMACAAGFVQCRKSLVDQQDVHVVNILLDSHTGV